MIAPPWAAEPPPEGAVSLLYVLMMMVFFNPEASVRLIFECYLT